MVHIPYLDYASSWYMAPMLGSFGPEGSAVKSGMFKRLIPGGVQVLLLNPSLQQLLRPYFRLGHRIQKLGRSQKCQFFPAGSHLRTYLAAIVFDGRRFLPHLCLDSPQLKAS